MNNLITNVFIILAMLVGFASAEGFDDFVNDLYSDLAPLLALFGERVTMQFISQALGFADCIALAMAPLGIITIMVSAIRVGGPTWLKAVVGRAKENKAAAELELMSSTSREVCELYNGENIVRCLGSGSVWQYICLFQRGTGSGETENAEIEFMTPDEAVSGGLLVLEDATGTVKQRIWKMLHRNVLPASLVSRQKEACVERHTTEPRRSKVIVIHDDSPEAPNISLNLQGTRRRTWIRIVACLGVFLQVGILIFFWAMVYHQTFRLKFTKDDKPVPNYAFPVAFTGTVALVISMLLCAHVVERGTEEKSYQVDDNLEMRHYWVQGQQTVNDQVFESFSIEQGKPCSTFSISRREEKYRQKPWHENWQQIKAIVGVMVGMAGFILQFVGLRHMNAYASLSQLAAVGLMTLLRAVIFPGFTTSFKPTKLVPHFELDWLAQKLGIHAGLICNGAAEDGEEEENTDSEDCSLTSWSILHDRKADSEALEPLIDEMNQPPASEAQHLLVTRRGLGKLAKIHTTSSKCAARLATAMEKALGILFPNGPGTEGAQGFRWVIDVSMGGATHQAWIDLSFENKAWRVPTDCLEAVISLWAYTVEAEKQRPKPSPQERQDPRHAVITASPQERRVTFREVVTGCCESSDDTGNEASVIHDLEVWVPHDAGALVASRETSEERENGVRRRLNRTRATGCDDPGPQTPESNGSSVEICASDLIFSLMWSMAKTLRGRIMGKAQTWWNGTCEPGGPLWNDGLTQLATAFALVSCRSRKGTVSEIVSALSVTGKLPVPQPWFSSLSTAVMQGYRAGNVDSIKEAITQALYLIRTYSNGRSGIVQRGVAWLLGLFFHMPCGPRWPERSHEPRLSPLEDLRETLRGAIVESIHLYLGRSFLEEMSALYRKQGREMAPEFRRDRFDRYPELSACVEATPLHLRATTRGLRNSRIPHEEQAFVDAQDICNWTPLHWAASLKNIQLAKNLLDLHADTTLKDFGGFTAAHYACWSGCEEIVEMLIEKGVRLDVRGDNGVSPMHLAAWKLRHKIVRIMMDHEEGQFPRTRLNPLPPKFSGLRDFGGRLPVHWAVVAGSIKIVQMLKGDVNAQDGRGFTPLHTAVIAGQYHLIEPLVMGMSAEAEVKDKVGCTALVLACSVGRWEAVKALVDAGANVNDGDSDGMTALHHMVARGATMALIQTLTKHLSSMAIRRLVNSQDRNGRTPLHLAARNEDLHIAKGLLEAEADPSVTNNRGETPLFYGISGAKTDEGASQMARLLFKDTGCLNFMSFKGKNIIEVAWDRGLDGAAFYLQDQKKLLEHKAGTDQSAAPDKDEDWSTSSSDEGCLIVSTDED